MITRDELAAMIAALESQPHLSIKEEKYLAVCKALKDSYRQIEVAEHERDCHMDIADYFKRKLSELKGCNHNWNALRLIEAASGYQYCTLCGVKRVAS